ncbi:MAG: CehA/McbA family metallohydrolase [Bryobacteraceae bacterium]
MIPTSAPAAAGVFRVQFDGALIAGQQADLRLEYETGTAGLPAGSRIRIGLPNTGWDRPVVPQQRYWDELICGGDRRLAPFHPVNTTARIPGRTSAALAMDVMERMLAPNEDPAFAYWRWWITLRLEEEAALAPGERIEIVYGDQRFGIETRIQTFAETAINISAFIQRGGEGPYLQLQGSPFCFDVVPGPPARANVILPSVHRDPFVIARVSLTDACHCLPAEGMQRQFRLGPVNVRCIIGHASEIAVHADGKEPLCDGAGAVWGTPNPSVPVSSDGLSLFWGDLHAQSEHHVMHSQKNDFRQAGWSKGISCGTLDECYSYARNISLLDFVAITDQGACLTDAWEYCQEKVRQYHEPGRFVVFKGYEAGSPLGHRNVIYATDTVESPLDARRFNTFHPDVVFSRYRGRGDAIIIPHHVKTWTDWNYHDLELEPLMEIYSCWGQSESPGLDLWNKGQTPGAGAWEAFGRGYRMGMIASSDNHVGMPGRSYPGDRQVHTPFAGGLCAIWARELTRESLFEALRERRCYGTTGARIVIRFSIGGSPMGSAMRREGGRQKLRLEISGAAPIERVEVVRNLQTWRTLQGAEQRSTMAEEISCDVSEPGFYYLRVRQTDGQRAWTSPIWID